MKTSLEIKKELQSLGIYASVYKVKEDGVNWTRVSCVVGGVSNEFTREQCNVIQLYLQSINAISIAGYYGQTCPKDFGVQPHMVEFWMDEVSQQIADGEEDYGLNEALKSLPTRE
jgi:hypothetical protein